MSKENELFEIENGVLVKVKNKDITEAVIPDSVVSIESKAFQNCTSLTNVIIPKSVKKIEAKAFFGCTMLNSVVVISSSGTKIEVGAFSNCSLSFSFYTLEGEKIEIENICMKEDWFLGTIKDVSEISIPQGVAGIAADAFCLCKTLEKVIIPEGVTIIGEGAFFGCESLKKIVLPNSLSEIEVRHSKDVVP